MVRKINRLGEKENPGKKYCGTYSNILPFGYGSGRLIVIKNKTGKKVFPVYWKELEKQKKEKNIKLGDKIRIDYVDFHNYKMKKITGK